MTQHLYAQDYRKFRRIAEELLRQCDHYERNGPGDEIRFGLLYNLAGNAQRVARRAYKRYHREQGWEWTWPAT